MDVDKAIALITAAGVELTDRRRAPDDRAWRLSFSNGAVVEVTDAGKLSTSGKGVDEIERALGLPKKAARPAHRGKTRR